ncbi:MAG: NTP transferase domain-containing protein [Coriobacteriales bacterium]|nr:NTP transferase domain-containing protein [Coriobacteriales bacterium]
MTKEEFYILNNLYESSLGRAQSGADIQLMRALQNKDTYRELCKKGLIDAESGVITQSGLAELEPYCVNNAVILAAGSATRFIPLSLEQPKGLYEVRGEKLIERQIQQLHEAGINNITIVLGYKKDMFAYLAEKYHVNLLFNPAYNVKNNIESLLVAKKCLGNSYICVCDSYFIENPFHKFEYQSFYAGFSTEETKDEMYAHIDQDCRIISMEKAEDGGLMLLGHAYWDVAFSRAFIELAEADKEVGNYDHKFWEWLLKDNLNTLPAIYFKEYAPGSIFEFDYFEQLRQFDTEYIGHAHSDIIRNIKLVFRCDEEDIVDFRTVHEGLTNTSFIFQINGIDYIYRHPGNGTESIINRRDEKTSLIKARDFGIDPTYIYMDVLEGWKISKFVNEFREPDYGSFEDSKKIIAAMRRLHATPVKVDYGMKPWEDALTMERLLKEKDADCFIKHEELKQKIGKLYERTIGDGVEKCFCHGDTYKPNWMIKPDGEVILIDWEYSGYSDPGIDVGYYIVDAMYDFEDALCFIREYLGDNRSDKLEFHYMAYVAIIAYYWFVWAMYRESCGANMGEALLNWHDMAVKYADYLVCGFPKNMSGQVKD